MTGGSYREYIIGGILVQSLAFGLVGPATSIATDLTEGIVDRFRSLPMARSAYLVGWRIHTDVPHAAAAFGVLILFATAMLWLGTLLGVAVRSPDAVAGIAFITMFALTFLANAFVPADGLPDGLRTIAEYNPVSAVIAATRTLFGIPTVTPADAAWPLQHPVIAAIA